jgi:hypothetical protein
MSAPEPAPAPAAAAEGEGDVFHADFAQFLGDGIRNDVGAPEFATKLALLALREMSKSECVLFAEAPNATVVMTKEAQVPIAVIYAIVDEKSLKELDEEAKRLPEIPEKWKRFPVKYDTQTVASVLSHGGVEPVAVTQYMVNAADIVLDSAGADEVEEDGEGDGDQDPKRDEAVKKRVDKESATMDRRNKEIVDRMMKNVIEKLSKTKLNRNQIKKAVRRRVLLRRVRVVLGQEGAADNLVATYDLEVAAIPMADTITLTARGDA